MIKISFSIDHHYPIGGVVKIILRLSENQQMSVILILLIASISVAGIFLAAFLWGVRTGQFEDDFSPASRILFEDKPASSAIEN